MNVSSSFSSALTWVQNGLENLQKNASHITNAGYANGTDLHTFTESIVDIKVSELQVKASIEVVKTYDKVLGTLLDVKA